MCRVKIALTPHPSYGSADAHKRDANAAMHLKKVGQCRLTSAEQAASIRFDSIRFGSARRCDVTLCYVTLRRAATAKKIRSSWPRVPLRRSDQPAKWTRPRWRLGDWRRVTKRDPVRTAVIRAYVCVYVGARARAQAATHAAARTSHAWEGNEVQPTS